MTLLFMISLVLNTSQEYSLIGSTTTNFYLRSTFFLYEETNFMMDSFISVGPVYKLAGIVLTGQKTEAVVWRCSAEKMFFEISQNSQENTCARVPFLIKLQALGLQIY